MSEHRIELTVNGRKFSARAEARMVDVSAKPETVREARATGRILISKSAMARVRAAGGEVYGEPMAIPGVGQYVAFADTEGNRLSMLQPIPKNWHAPKQATATTHREQP